MDNNQPDGATVLHSDPTTQAGFTIIPNAILRARHLSPGSRLLYGLLKMYAWQAGNAYPGQERLAEELGVSTRQIRNYQAELVSAGLLRVEQRGLTQTNRYWIEEIPADFLSDRKDNSGQEVAVTSGQDRKPVSDKEDADQEDSVRRESVPPAPARKSAVSATEGIPPQPPAPVKAESSIRELRPVPKGTAIKARPDAPPVLKKTPCPEAFPITPDMQDWADEHTPEIAGDLPALTGLFVAHYRSKDERRADWYAAWQGFMWRKREDARKDAARAAPRPTATVTGHRYRVVSKGA